MTVNKLIQKLMALPEADRNRLVVMAKDPEGNGFRLLEDADLCTYEDGEIGLDELTDDLRAKGYSEEDLLENGTPALCLWP